MDETRYWQAVEQRDASFDQQFVYAVQSTHIYCRPSCSSRRPLRSNVRFFATPVAAEEAGFRACRRCRPNEPGADTQRELVEQICQYLSAPHEQTPTLADLGARFATSPFHLQRVFRQIVGVTPRQYADARRQERLREHLRSSESVTTAMYEAGYGSNGAFYASSVAALGMQPSEYRQGGRNTMIRYTMMHCQFGFLLVAATERGVCSVTLGDAPEALLATLHNEFPAATVQHDDDGLADWVHILNEYLAGHVARPDLPMDVRATAFQRQVWEALRAIPYGETRSYRQIATVIGQPNATRAVARACATNPVALLTPCHRVIRENGELGGYRWGIDRKRALLEHEAVGVHTP
jgi:AraC family transcriptional regulator of adaptative response/methylated-DNA-[protein]-cysteine methyltransferase